MQGQTGEKPTATVHKSHSVHGPSALASIQTQTFTVTSAQPSGSPPGLGTQGEATLSLVSAGRSTLLSWPAVQDWQGRQSGRARTGSSHCRDKGQTLGTYKVQVPLQMLLHPVHSLRPGRKTWVMCMVTHSGCVSEKGLPVSREA